MDPGGGRRDRELVGAWFRTRFPGSCPSWFPELQPLPLPHPGLSLVGPESSGSGEGAGNRVWGHITIGLGRGAFGACG